MTRILKCGKERGMREQREEKEVGDLQNEVNEKVIGKRGSKLLEKGERKVVGDVESMEGNC